MHRLEDASRLSATLSAKQRKMFKFVVNLSIWVLLIAVSQSQAKKVQVTELTNGWTLKDTESGR